MEEKQLNLPEIKDDEIPDDLDEMIKQLKQDEDEINNYDREVK